MAIGSASVGASSDSVALPADAFVIGEPVEVVEVDYDGNARRGLTARCRRAVRLRRPPSSRPA